MWTGSEHVELVVIDALPAGTADRAELLVAVDGWTWSVELAELLTLFGQRLGATGPSHRLAELEAFTNAQFNFRTPGLERWEASQPTFPPTVGASARAVLEAFARPRRIEQVVRTTSDHLLVLGGQLPRVVQRVLALRQLLARGYRPSRVWALGSGRILTAQETRVAADLGLGRPADEADLLREALRRFVPDRPDAVVLSAEAAEGAARATTIDNLAAFAHSARPARAATITMLTAAQFAPYQHAHALQYLGLEHASVVRTVGVRQGSSGPLSLRAEPSTADLLQEIHSTVRALRSLLGAALAS